MPVLKMITVSLPVAIGKEIEKVAKAEHRTVSELIRDAFRQYQTQRNLRALASEGRKAAKRKKLAPKDFGLTRALNREKCSARRGERLKNRSPLLTYFCN